MADNLHLPTELGQPCWEKVNIPLAITSVAKMEQAQSHYFLACHAPIKRIYDDLRRKVINEQEFYDELFDSSRGNVLAIVHGDPGTGKSHLIHWLKLRCDSDVEGGIHGNFVPVLIQRRTGSLKDALDQMLQQLGEEFADHLTKVREAIGEISAVTARENLASRMSDELGSRWAERGRAPLPPLFRSLRETCESQGFREWLCREGGIIDANIKRLIEESGVEEREQSHFPEFTPDEFSIGEEFKWNNTPDVIDLIYEFDARYEAREQAAAYFNMCLKHAIKELSGLSGNKLRDIFDKVRATLKDRGKTLALFIEDVSVMSSLDEEVINAVEPQPRADLCRMIAVIGITDTGLAKLPENQRSRGTLRVSVGGTAVEAWLRNPEEVAEFAARYLNAIRLDEARVRQIAQYRSDGGDVNRSACTSCPVRDTCHSTFGSVLLGGTRIGLFPFSGSAPHTLLSHLDETTEDVRRNPRGLLEHVLRPILADRDHLEGGDFPRPRQLPVRLNEPLYWAEFEQTYCGGWQPRDKERLKMLAQAWVVADTAADAATQLQPFLSPFKFNNFTGEGRPKKEKKGAGRETGRGANDGHAERKQQEVQRSDAIPENVQQLQRIVDALGQWLVGKRLNDDAKPRDYLADFIRKSVPTDEALGLPQSVWDRHTGTKDFIEIDGMRSAVRGTFTVFFPRNEETRALIESLARFHLLGKKSWNFETSEIHKRVAARWLRRNKAAVLSKLQANDGNGAAPPVESAAQFLVAAALLRRRSSLPRGADLVKEVISNFDSSPPSALSSDFTKLADEIQAKHGAVREFLLDELNVPQGAGGILFINPIPIIQAASKFQNDVSITSPPEVYSNGFWKSRYLMLKEFSKFLGLKSSLEREREEIEERLSTIRSLLARADFSTEDLATSLSNFCEEMLNLLETQRRENFETHHEFKSIKTHLTSKRAPWAAAVREAEALLERDKVIDVLAFDTSVLDEAARSLGLAGSYLDKVEEELNQQGGGVVDSGDPQKLTEDLLTLLERVSNNLGPTAK